MPLRNPDSVEIDQAIQQSVEIDLDLRVRQLVRRVLSDIQRVQANTLRAAEQDNTQRSAIEAERAQQMSAIEARFRSAKSQADRELQSRRTQGADELEQGHLALEGECHAAVDAIATELKRLQARSAKSNQEAIWLARTVCDAKRDQLRKHLNAMRKQLRARLRVAADLRSSANSWLTNVGIDPAPLQSSDGHAAGDDPRRQMQRALSDAEQFLLQLQQQRLPGMLHGASVAWVFLTIAMVVAPLSGWLLSWNPWSWLPVGSAVIVVLGAFASSKLRNCARQRALRVGAELYAALREVDDCGAECLRLAVSVYQQERARAKESLEAETQRAAAEHREVTAQSELRRNTEIPQLTAQCADQLDQLQSRYEQEMQMLVDAHERAMVSALAARERDMANAVTNHQRALREHDAECVRQHAEIEQQRNEALAAALSEVASIERQLGAGDSTGDSTLSVSRAIRFGRVQLDVGALIAGAEGEASRDLFAPALLPFPQGLPLQVQVEPTGAAAATDLLRVVLLRLLTTVPAGSLRLTIVDAQGLGKDLSALMHLVDYDASLVGGRIWTDPADIERRLAELSEHVEMVTQKYLRDEFDTIEVYNKQAGEIAEPYRLVVVLNYPAGLNDAALHRFQKIVQTGPRCGVYTIVTTSASPSKRSPASLPSATSSFRASRHSVAWLDADFASLPLSVDPVPSPAECKQLLHDVGRAAAVARRVEVPFEVIAPSPDRYWSESSAEGIDLPLGRSGATRLQHLRLGRGTAQHVLIAGKTGSGKSSLLHALVTGAALRYSPAELELYLIDFKKGVEFKTYATHALPHAKVIAIESEREFGLSVMQRLDDEMRRRGDLFRLAGVQDIAAYRRQGESLARVLFVVDEFQEFFVEDDRIARDAALLLDRLVRQGRAFGIHVHLGSQTLGGAYTLARTTLGQMAVRIALQCSESDAHLILSEDNTAARLLSRPGEAIYNDANGFVEGNHSFQVVWLSDDRREFYLAQLRELAKSQGVRPTPAVVFEGMRPSAIELCAPLNEPSVGSLAASQTPRIWLGEPIAIREATSVELQSKPSANLLFLGQNAEANSGMLLASLVSLLASASAADERSVPKLSVLDGSTGEAAHRIGLKWLQEHYGADVHTGRVSEADALVRQLYAELQARQHHAEQSHRPLYLIVYGLTSFRSLRRADDDFGFSRSADAELSVAAMFDMLLQEGPSLGIHLLVWCDSLPAVQRMLGRQALREFGARVLLQMSSNDSNLLIDQPSASALGAHRALLHIEDEGRLEKFRPFALPTVEWLQAFCASRAVLSVAAEPLSG